MPKHIIRSYQDYGESHVYLNTHDQDLQPFRVELPQPENIEEITNYGLLPDEQVFVREKVPRQLQELEEDIRMQLRPLNLSPNEKEQRFVDQIWDEIDGSPDKYREIRKWITDQWYYRLYGKWYFINGKPTYLDGWHWFYLNYWTLEQVGLPEYRDRDRRWFHGQRYILSTTEAPKINSEGNVMYHPDGTLVMEDKGIRTFAGSNVLKARQKGDTSKAQSILYEIISRTFEGRGGIQAESENKSSFVFRRKQKLPVQKMHFIFWPTLREIDPGKVLQFSSKERDKGIDASIDYAETVYRTFYDGENLNGIHVDEPGKLDKRESVKARHEVLRKCVQELEGIMLYTTTVYEMETSAGIEFLELTKQSHFQNRNQMGQTTSGLCNLFLPATEAAHGFVGKFGESIIDTPTKEQIPYLGKKIKNSKGEYMGAMEALQYYRQDYERKGDLVGLANEKRMEPLSFRDCFTPAAQSQFFDHEIITTRMSELRMNPPGHVMRGNFMWVGSKFSNKVKFVQDDTGRWVVSKRLTGNEANRIIKRGNVYYPNNGHKYVSVGDAFRAEKVEGGKMSYGGGAVYRVWDKTVDDPNNKDTNQFETRQPVCTYLYRPQTVNEYVEDMLKQDIYFGAFQFPENNITHIEEKYKEWGYYGYLLYGYNKTTGKKNNVAGFYTNYATKPIMFNKGRDWIKQHGPQCEHLELLKEFNEIRNPDDLTNHDLLASFLGCLMAEDILVERVEFKDNIQTFDLTSVYSLNYY